MTRAITQHVNSPAAGIVQDSPPNAIDRRAWSDGLNIRFINGRVETSPGWEKFTAVASSSPVKHIAQYKKYDNTDFAIRITNTKVERYDPGTDTWIDITGASPLTGVTDDFVQSDTAFDTYMFTNNVDRVKKWGGTGNISNLGGLSTADDGAGGTVDVTAAKGLTAFAGFMHLVNTQESSTRYAQRWRWSRFGNHEGWNNQSTYGQAGFADLVDGPDKLQTAIRLGGDFIALYKEDSISIAQYVGPPTVWSRRLVVNGVGLLAPGAVTNIVNEHIFCASDNFYIFNGLAIKPVGDAIFDQFISELNPSKAHLMWAHTIYEYNEVIFAYPSGSSEVPNRAVVLNYMTGAWAFRDMPFLCMGPYRRTTASDTWDSDSEAWNDDDTRWDDARLAENAPLHLAGDADGHVHDYGVGFSQDEENHDSYVISPAIDMGRPDLIKRWMRIIIEVIATGTYNMEVSYLTVKSPNTVLNWSAAKNFPCDLSTHPWVTVDVSGRYLFLRFRTNHTARPWKLTAYGWEAIYSGRY